jgi:hypothetical protein
MARRELKDLAKRVFRQEGDAIEGDVIIAQARKTGKTYVVPGTSNHKIQETILRSNVICVIDKPFMLRGEPFQLSSNPPSANQKSGPKSS